MKVLAKISKRMLYVVGYPNSGWRIAISPELDAIEVYFNISVQEDGSGGVNLCLESLDRKYVFDSNYSNRVEALAATENLYGISRHEWPI